MPLELKDLATDQKFEVPNAGHTVGRKGGKAELQLEEAGISNRHARIYAIKDAWFVEDLGSANGTFVGESRITGPTPISPNDVVSIARTRLLVMGLAWDPNQNRTLLVQPAMSAEEAQALLAQNAKGAPKAPAAAPAPEAADKTAPVGRPAVEAADATSEEQPAPAKVTTEDQFPEQADAGAVPEKLDLKYFMVAVPKAVAFYLGAIPLMIVNPVGTIRKGVVEQKHAAKERMELIAYALPVNLFSAAIGFFSTLIVQLVTHTFSIGGLIVGLLVVPAIIAVIASVVTGFIWHPVVGWVVNKLKGESDAGSRTNYFMMFMTATALVAIPNGIGTLLGLVPFRLVAMVQPALSALGSVVVLFVTYSWMKQFNVVKWFQTVLLVLGALALVGGVFGMIGRLSTPAGMGVGSGGGDMEARMAALQKEAQEAAKANAEATDKATAAVKDGEAAVAKAEEQVAAVEKPAAEKVAAAEKPAAADKGGSLSYPAFNQMRDAIEKKIADDPTLLNHTPGLLDLYHQYTNVTFEVDSKYKKLTAKKPSDAALNARLRDAELFEKSQKLVREIHAKLIH